MSSMLNQFRSFSPFLKLVFLFMMIFMGMIIITIVGLALALPFYGYEAFSILMGNHDLKNPQHLAFLRYVQIVSHFAMFIIPALLYAKLFESGSLQFFALRRKQSWLIILIGGFSMIVLLPFVNWLGDINAAMKLPDSMKELEKWMLESENTAEKMIMAFVSETQWHVLLVNLFMVAIIPAIGEEFIFRGIIMRKLREWFGNIHIAVFVSAFIFSAFHVQFYGFLPRIFLGMLLGYMFVWSGSLWLPMFAHFFNNGFAIVIAWMHQSGYITQDMDSFGNFSNEPGILLLTTSMAFTVLAILWYLNKKTNPYYSKYI